MSSLNVGGGGGAAAAAPVASGAARDLAGVATLSAPRALLPPPLPLPKPQPLPSTLRLIFPARQSRLEARVETALALWNTPHARDCFFVSRGG